MDLKFTEEQEMMRKMVRDFAQKEVAPIAAEIDDKGIVPFENIKKMAQLGLLGLTVPEKYDGGAADPGPARRSELHGDRVLRPRQARQDQQRCDHQEYYEAFQ